jgi:ABC-type polysaccharide transport system permease subunit
MLKVQFHHLDYQQRLRARHIRHVSLPELRPVLFFFRILRIVYRLWRGAVQVKMNGSCYQILNRQVLGYARSLDTLLHGWCHAKTNLAAFLRAVLSWHEANDNDSCRMAVKS